MTDFPARIETIVIGIFTDVVQFLVCCCQDLTKGMCWMGISVCFIIVFQRAHEFDGFLFR